ncbi:MAG: Hsp20/alpha crystallin family protein [Spirochaetaceae bacterium]|nr:Hsp20/alpha crystallin family protein [Spirochaetaceae bacterium]
MKGSRGYVDLGTILDEVFEAAQDFRDEIHRNFGEFGPGMRREGPFSGRAFGGKNPFDENVDYYPNYSYPPMNVYMKSDRTMVFEFALAGFDEKDISLSFQGDYMVFSAKIPGEEGEEQIQEENFRYFKRRLKMKDIEKQKYFVPLDKYAQEEVKAVFRNGILKVTIPPKEEPDPTDGVKIEIIREGE